jgi:GntR family histidine utilization transcriptional repressor
MASEKGPAYGQVKSFIRTRVASGDWKPGDPVPSESTLMEQFGISRMTVNRALRELANEGIVVRVQGSGTRVAQLHRISSTLTIRDIHDEVAERGHVHSVRIVSKGPHRAEPAIARALSVRTGSKVFHTVLVHLENGVPIQYEDRYVNPAAAPNFLDCDFTQITPTHYLLEHAPLTEASYSIEAWLPSGEEASLLGIHPAEPCLVMHRRTVSGAHVASVARLIYPGSRYAFEGKFQA